MASGNIPHDIQVPGNLPIEEQIKLWRDAIKKFPDAEGTYQVMLFMVYNFNHQPKEAKKCVDRIIELYEGKKDIGEDGTYSLGMAYHFKAYFSEEKPDAKTIVELEKKKIALEEPCAEAYVQLASAFCDDKDYENCKMTLEKILDMKETELSEDHYNKQFYYNGLIEMYDAKKDYAEIIKCNEKLLELTEYCFYDPQEYHENIAKAMKKLGITEKYDEHGKTIEYLKKKIKEETDPTHLWRHHNNIALAYRGANDRVNERKSFQKAIDVLEEMINDPELWYNKFSNQKSQADIYYAIGNVAKTFELYEEVAANQKDDQLRFTLKDLAEYHATINQLGKAEEYYYKMLKLDKRDSQALEGLCQLYVHQKKFDLLDRKS